MKYHYFQVNGLGRSCQRLLQAYTQRNPYEPLLLYEILALIDVQFSKGIIVAYKKGAGGIRAGSGRPKHSGKYREATHPVRVPKSLLEYVKSLLQSHKDNIAEISGPEEAWENYQQNDQHWYRLKSERRLTLPLFGHSVAAGQPQKVEDHIDEVIDLNQYVAPASEHTFLLRVQGDSMIDAGIQNGDLLVVDSKLTAKSGKIVIAVVNGELTVKRLIETQEGVLQLQPENPLFSVLTITDEMSFQILGVVTFVLHHTA